MPPLKVILDTDPGGDDIFALIWLLSLVQQGHLELVAVTTAAGNVGADRTFANASQVLSLTGFGQTVVGRGAAVSDQPTANAAHIHGTDGMGNLSQSFAAGEHDFATAPAADDLIIAALNQAPQEVTLIAIGPLTNLAAAEAKQPGILRKAREIVVMGGAFTCPGNVTAQAEFNIWFNPAAAQVVLGSRSDVVIVPLDVTRRLVFTETMADSVRAANPQSPVAPLLTQLTTFLMETSLSYRETSGQPGFLVHDAATLAYLVYPETLLLKRAAVQVETQGQWTQGQTLMDRRHCPKQANAWVALDVNETGFFDCLIEDLRRFLRAHKQSQ